MAHAEGGQESLPGGDQKWLGWMNWRGNGGVRRRPQGLIDKIGSDVQSQARNSTGSANNAFNRACYHDRWRQIPRHKVRGRPGAL